MEWLSIPKKYSILCNRMLQSRYGHYSLVLIVSYFCFLLLVSTRRKRCTKHMSFSRQFNLITLHEGQVSIILPKGNVVLLKPILRVQLSGYIVEENSYISYISRMVLILK